jgi:regulator of replication initiation timing
LREEVITLKQQILDLKEELINLKSENERLRSKIASQSNDNKVDGSLGIMGTPTESKTNTTAGRCQAITQKGTQCGKNGEIDHPIAKQS